MRLAPEPREAMEERWAEVRTNGKSGNGVDPADVKQDPPPRPLNLDAVLDLGTIVYFTFRGRAYGIPPLAWRAGQKILDAYLRAEECGREITRENAREYFDALRDLQDVLWRNTRSVGRIRRLLRRVRLIRNPFRGATEKEIVDLARFMLGRRTSGTGLRLAGAQNERT